MPERMISSEIRINIDLIWNSDLLNVVGICSWTHPPDLIAIKVINRNFRPKKEQVSTTGLSAADSDNRHILKYASWLLNRISIACQCAYSIELVQLNDFEQKSEIIRDSERSVINSFRRLTRSKFPPLPMQLSIDSQLLNTNDTGSLYILPAHRKNLTPKSARSDAS